MARKFENLGPNLVVEQFPDPKPKRSVGVIWRETSPISEDLIDISSTLKETFYIVSKI